MATRIFKVEVDCRKCPTDIGLYLFSDYALFLNFHEALNYFFESIFDDPTSASMGTRLSFQEFKDENDCVDGEMFEYMIYYDCDPEYFTDRSVIKLSNVVDKSYFEIYTQFNTDDIWAPDLEQKLVELKETIVNNFDTIIEKYQKKK